MVGLEGNGFMENRAMLASDAKKTFSFSRAIRHLAHEGGDPGFELEVSAETQKRFGASNHGGIMVPLDQPVEVRAGLVQNTNSAGGFTVQTTIQPLIELLRNAMVVRAAGATVLEGLSDSLAFPKQLTPGTANWVAENPGSDNVDADLTLGQITMTPKMLTSNTSFSRKLMAQSSLDVESLVRTDLIEISAVALDLAALNGLGSSNQPTGILNTTGVNAIAHGTNGAAPTYADFVAMETLINVSNVPISAKRSYVITPEVLAYGRKTAKVSGQLLGAIVNEDGSINGYRTYVTNQLPKTLTLGTATDCHAGIFGNWDALMIGVWSAIEILVDPYRLKKQGMIEVSSYLMCDLAVRFPVAFSFSKYWSAALL
jgi:HK97 family phage major capsid protein